MCYNLNMNKYLLKIIYWAPIVFIVFFLFIFPLIFSSFIYSYNVFELLKGAVLWPAVLLLLLLSLIKIFVFNINIKNYLNNNFIFIFLILIIFLIFNTFIVADNYDLALFGDYNRRQGLFTQLSYIVFFSLMVFNLMIVKNFKKTINYILFSISLSGFLVALYGFMQYIGLDYFIWQETVISGRVISSIGQPNFLASFLLLSLGVSIATLFKFKNIYLKLFFIIIIFFHLLTIYLSASRSAFIALILVFIISLFTLIKKRKNLLILFFSSLISCLIFIILFINYLPDNRFTQTFNFKEGSTLARKEFYATAFEIIKEKPVFGHGLEQAGNRFVAYYNPDWALFSKVNDYPDRAHNIVLDLIINFGIIGFLIYLSIFIYSIYFLLFKNKKKEKYLYFIYLSIIAYIISLLFSFPSLATSLYFWSLLAILFSFSIYNLSKGKEKLDLMGLNFKYRIIILALIIISILFFYISFNNSLRTIKADEKFLLCHNSLIYNDLDNFHYCWQALELTTDISQRNYYFVTIINYYIDNYSRFDLEFKELFDNYLHSLYNEINNNNYELVFTKAKLACYLKKDDYKERFNYLINYSLKRPAVYYAQANCYNYLKDYENAIDNYNIALALLPDIKDSRLNKEHKLSLKKYSYLLFFALGQSYALSEDYEKAIIYFKQAYNNNPENIDIFKNIGQAYYLLENYSQAIESYLYAYKKDQTNNYWPLKIYEIYNKKAK